ncbi:MAG: restriction endonuclease subunit S, partial [Candidatus Kapabacteria bacterium]|nr:restriction endonuclease subunit S [Candidatus Kapabacteria bacterium]
MMKYEKYKPSGIQWLGNIPDTWEIKRVKDTSNTKSGTTPHSGKKYYYENGVFNWVRTTDLNDGELYDVEYKINQLALDECRLSFLPIDTILVAMYGGFGTIGKNSILKKPSTINQSVCAILPSRKLSSNYLMYFLKYFRVDWKLFADGARKDPNINQDAVKNLFIIYPPLSEQTAIAEYLDTKTQANDKKINLLTKKAETYKELRKSIINDAVCKGLDKSVKLKESGV